MFKTIHNVTLLAICNWIVLGSSITHAETGGGSISVSHSASGQYSASVNAVKVNDQGTWEVKLDGNTVAVLNSDLKGSPGLHPLLSPAGHALTRKYPIEEAAPHEMTDHPHHRSFWFNHGIVNGIDFWLDRNVDHLGKIVQTNASIKSTDRTATIVTANAWVGPDREIVLRDEREFLFHKINGHHVIDFRINLIAEQPGDDTEVVFGDTKEGTLGIRVAGTMKVDAMFGGAIENAQGDRDEATWSQASDWVDYSGPVAPVGETKQASADPKEWPIAGITVLAHPKNEITPTRWHVRTYGLFAANPFGRRDFGQPAYQGVKIPAGESLEFRYRIVLHDGGLDRSATETMMKEYATQ